MVAAMQWIKRSLTAATFALPFVVSANVAAQSPEYNYLLHCGGCHIEDGSGMPPHVPDLRVDMPFFASFTEGRAYIARVPGVVQSPMTDEQLTQVLNMILDRFTPAGSNLQPYTAEEVRLYQQEVLLDPQKLRDQLTALRSDISMVNADVDDDLEN